MNEEGVVENIELVVVHAHHIRLHHFIEATLVRQAFIEVGVVIGPNVKGLPEGMLPWSRLGLEYCEICKGEILVKDDL